MGIFPGVVHRYLKNIAAAFVVARLCSVEHQIYSERSECCDASFLKLPAYSARTKENSQPRSTHILTSALVVIKTLCILTVEGKSR